MVKLISSFSRLKPAHVLVVGDFMLDTYTMGFVQRISPEAPVPILHVEKMRYLPGGAGNVALNLKALGATVVCVGRIGPDPEGERLKALFLEEGIDTSGLFVQEEVRTPVKNRLIANCQQLMRVDDENFTPINHALESASMSFIKNHLDKIQVIAISDYGKGFLSKALLRSLIDEGNQRGIPVLVDPKGHDFTRYEYATMVKPNFKEALEAAKLGSEATLDTIGRKLVCETKAQHMIITRSKEGISLFDQKNGRYDFPVKSREVIDVTGAGDTVLAIMAMAYAAQLNLCEGVHLANIAAGIAVQQLGCARVSLSDIAKRFLETDVENKIFSEHHLFALEQVLKDKKFTLLGLSTRGQPLVSLLSKVQSLATSHESEQLIVYLIDQEIDEHFVSLLSSFNEVDFIVLQSESLSSLCERIHPAEAYVLEGGNLLRVEHHDDLVNRQVPALL